MKKKKIRKGSNNGHQPKVARRHLLQQMCPKTVHWRHPLIVDRHVKVGNSRRAHAVEWQVFPDGGQ